ncbi:MAG: FAD binding domain-containing protein, partial [Spirochaetaceae bacterium]|nr:FAD binding domain-containing protein [Spirochaetaceae bacterium]
MSTSSQFAAPRTIEEATALLAEHGSSARVVAGATDLMVQVRITGSYPEHYVDIKHIPDVNVIELQDGCLQLGAAVSCAALADRDDVRAAFPGLVEASELIGSTQIQSRATLGGNLCNASPAADTVPSLMALDADAVIAGPAGTRTVKVSEVPTGPGSTSLAAGEMLVAFRIPGPAAGSSGAYQRFIPRAEIGNSFVGVVVGECIEAEGSESV